MRNCHKVLVSQFAFGWRVVDRRNHWTHRGADIITWIPRFPSQWNHCISISNDSCTPSVKHFHFTFKKRQTQTQTKQLRKNYWDNQRQKTSASERSARVHRITHRWGGCNRIERLNGKCHIFSKVVVVCTSVASFFGHVRVRCSIAVSYGKMDSKRHVMLQSWTGLECTGCCHYCVECARPMAGCSTFAPLVLRHYAIHTRKHQIVTK